MNSILKEVGQIVALPCQLLEKAALVILGLWVVLGLVCGVLLGIVAVLADEGAKKAMRWGEP